MQKFLKHFTPAISQSDLSSQTHCCRTWQYSFLIVCYKEEKGRGGDTTPLTHKAFMETLSAELLGRPLRNPSGRARAEHLAVVITDPVPGKVAGLVSSAG